MLLLRSLKYLSASSLVSTGTTQTRWSSSSTSDRLEAIVVGLGAHGSACLYHLAKWGSKVLGIERFGISHTNASHHGLTRITRLAYMEGPQYVPLLRKSFQAYEALQRETKQRLFWQTGVLNIGHQPFEGARATAIDQGLAHEVLTGQQAQQRFPGLRLPPDTPVLYEAVGGILEPEKTVQAHVAVALYHGAKVKTNEQVLNWSALSDGGVEVVTDKGTYTADRLVLSSGAWMGQLVPELKGLCVPGRATVAWFKTQQPELYSKERLPVFILGDGQTQFYGFPEFGAKPGLKIGEFCVPGACDPDNLDRRRTTEDLEKLLGAVQRFFPGAAGPVLDFAACMFVMTPDGHFVIDSHPKHPQVILCSACSGHGFKLSPAVGYVLADMVRHGECREFKEELKIHKLDRCREGHAEILDSFAAHVV